MVEQPTKLFEQEITEKAEFEFEFKLSPLLPVKHVGRHQAKLSSDLGRTAPEGYSLSFSMKCSIAWRME